MRHQQGPTSASTETRSRRIARKLGTLLLGAALVVGGAVVAPTPAEAANPTVGFNPGNIISDAKFYDGTAMSGKQVQSFLNKRVPRCTIGDKGREAWSPWNGTFIASVCLKDSTWTTQSRPSNAYCKALPGKTKESAANFIVRVGKACGISQRVLLILLEKEQSLITDTWPTARQYDRAMGHNCPDSGPNNSANCLGNGGFPSQVYRAAWQFKVYRALPQNYRYQPFQVNTVQYHPNTGCGTSRFKIANRATAALYIYTPYRPNKAALQAGWGTGDSCSTYGNRNFYSFYKSWFGTPTSGFAVHANLKKLYAVNKSLTGIPTSKPVATGGGVRQLFAKARMYWHPKTGASIVRGNVLAAYRADGEMKSSLGAPIGVQRAIEKTQNQRFQKGEMFWTQARGALQVRGTMYTHYKKFGGAKVMGVPRANAVGTRAAGVMQDFAKGSTNRVITWSTKAAPRIVSGKIRSRYLLDGGVKALGYATGKPASITGGKVQRFSKAEIYTNDSVGRTRTVKGEILKTFNSKGGAAKIGLPTSVQTAIPGGYRQTFDKKSITWTKTGGGVVHSLKPSAKPKATTNSEVQPTPTPNSATPSPEPTTSPTPEVPEAPEAVTPTPEEKPSPEVTPTPELPGMGEESQPPGAEVTPDPVPPAATRRR